MAASTGYDGFADRLTTTFAGLADTSSSAPTWQPSQQQVFRGGDCEVVSSDDEEDGVQEPLELPEGLLQMDTPGDDTFDPTSAFCRALDREEEYDAVDHVATGRDDADERPAGSTEVLPDNAYERRINVAANVDPPDADIGFGQSGEPPIRQASPPSTSPSTSGGRKRVRFATYVPPQRRSADGAELHRPQPGWQLKSSLKHRLASPVSQTGHTSTSSVPEHVRHPERFDCYVLDEPLLVGGGDQSDNALPAQHKVDIEEVEPADMDEKRELAPFGSGIQFRSKAGRTAAVTDKAQAPPRPMNSAAANASATPLAASFMSDPMDEDADGFTNTQLGGDGGNVKAPRQRTYRSRPAD